MHTKAGRWRATCAACLCAVSPCDVAIVLECCRRVMNIQHFNQIGFPWASHMDIVIAQLTYSVVNSREYQLCGEPTWHFLFLFFFCISFWNRSNNGRLCSDWRRFSTWLQCLDWGTCRIHSNLSPSPAGRHCFSPLFEPNAHYFARKQRFSTINGIGVIWFVRR